jgi:hypothetical protein
MFKYRRTLLGAFALMLGLALILVWAVGPGARAQDEAPAANLAPLEPKAPLEPAAPLGTAFTYQGQLTDDGSPAIGPCDFRFSLFDAASDGTQVGSVSTHNDVALNDGRFTVILDFGVGVFTGDARWLDIDVKCAGDSSYVTLGRQALTAAPYALYAMDAGNDHNHLAQTWSGYGAALTIINAGVHTATLPSPFAAVQGEAASRIGVVGTSGTGVGVAGGSTSNYGVLGVSTNSAGVQGESTNSFGVAAEGGGDSTGWDEIGDLELLGNRGEIIAPDGHLALISAASIWLFLDADDDSSSQFMVLNGDDQYVFTLDEDGDLWIEGTLTKGAGGFKIDHPLDPENRYLYHSFVESPDMMNVYNGNAILDADGEAWVELPDWFEALNEEFRYQLTCIGGYAPVYIAQEVEDNRFQIAGGTPGLKVSWQVTGIRHDAYAEANRLPVEEDKPSQEQGAYLHPAAYGLPESAGIPAPREVGE